MVGTQDSVLSVRIAAAWALAAGADAVKLAWASGQLSRHGLHCASSCIAQGVPVSLQNLASTLRLHWARIVHARHAGSGQGGWAGTSCCFDSMRAERQAQKSTLVLLVSDSAVGCSMFGPGAGL